MWNATNIYWNVSWKKVSCCPPVPHVPALWPATPDSQLATDQILREARTFVTWVYTSRAQGPGLQSASVASRCTIIALLSNYNELAPFCMFGSHSQSCASIRSRIYNHKSHIFQFSIKIVNWDWSPPLGWLRPHCSRSRYRECGPVCLIMRGDGARHSHYHRSHWYLNRH